MYPNRQDITQDNFFPDKHNIYPHNQNIFSDNNWNLRFSQFYNAQGTVTKFQTCWVNISEILLLYLDSQSIPKRGSNPPANPWKSLLQSDARLKAVPGCKCWPTKNILDTAQERGSSWSKSDVVVWLRSHYFDGDHHQSMTRRYWPKKITNKKVDQ